VTADKWAAYATRPYFFGKWDIPPIYGRALAGLAGTYVDIGAGDGAKLRYCIDQGYLAAFSTILAFEISPDGVWRLRQHLPGVVAQEGDAMALPLADQSVDFAMADQVIEHVADDRAMAREICRILAPAGRAIIGSVLKKAGAWYFYRSDGEWRVDPTHLRESRNLTEYASVLGDAGLEVLEMAEERLGYTVVELLLRALLTVRVLTPTAASDLKSRLPLFRMMSAVKLWIPRYYTCYAHVRRRIVD
jgi:SAM-dependent methyltransferase